MSRRTAALLVPVIVAITLGTGGAAWAHANYARSDPAPDAPLAAAPTRVVVDFTEKYASATSGLALIDRLGREVTSGGQVASEIELVLPLPPIPDGIYTVAWHTLSAVDGDAAKGYFAFQVGSVPTPSAPPQTQTKTQNGISVALGLSPAAPGKNDYLVTVKRGDAPLPNITRIRLRITPLDRDIGVSEIILKAATLPATYAGSGYQLPFAGRYKIQLQVRRSDTVDDLAFDFETAVATPTPSPSRTAASPAVSASVEPSAPSTSGLPGVFVVFGAVVVLMLVISVALAWRRA